MEMDAASNTGINDIREIIDSVKYGPVSAPFKVYIIDEVHMLSTAAFNGLLKTLEEPPPYVKFIFATTEIRKVPVTILSRCMRFDLRRVPPETMTEHLVDILDKEAIGYEPEALAMIVRAGEGSVRDNQSLLDQAISHGDGKVTAATVKAMLGLGDRARSIDLFEALMRGDIAGGLTLLRELYDAGADPETVIGDLADFTNLVTRLKIVPAAADDVSLTPDERSRGPELAPKLGMRALSRAWQILFKGIEEVKGAGNGLQAAEMVLVRLAYASELPSPDELISKLQNAPTTSTATASVPHRGPIGGGPQAARQFEPCAALRGLRRSGASPRARDGAAGVCRAEILSRAGGTRRREARHPAQDRARAADAAGGVPRQIDRGRAGRGRRPRHHPDPVAPAARMDRPDLGRVGVVASVGRPDHARRQGAAGRAGEGRGRRRSAGQGDHGDVPRLEGHGDRARGTDSRRGLRRSIFRRA